MNGTVYTFALLLATVAPLRARAAAVRSSGLADQLARSATHGFGRAVGSMGAHALGLPVAGAVVVLIVLRSVAARRRPARARARRR